MNARCACTTVIVRGERELLIHCWLLDAQHAKRPNHWSVVDGEPYEWPDSHLSREMSTVGPRNDATEGTA